MSRIKKSFIDFNISHIVVVLVVNLKLFIINIFQLRISSAVKQTV